MLRVRQLSSRRVQVGLEQLPTEILQQILYLIVTPRRCICLEWTHGRYAYSPRCIPSFVWPIPEPHSTRVSLLSKALSSVARPIEYETVYLATFRQLRAFSNMLSNRTRDSRRGLGVDTLWVKRLIVDTCSTSRMALRNLVTILTLCTKIHSIRLPPLRFSQRKADTDDFKRLLLSMWNAMPGTLRNLGICNESLIPHMSPSDEIQFVDTHRDISMVCFDHRMDLDSSQSLSLFPQLTKLNFERICDSHAQSFQNVDLSSIAWLRVGMIDSIYGGWFWGFQYTALVSLEFGRLVGFNSRNASMILSGAPNLEELRYHAYRNGLDPGVLVGWGTRNEETGLFVRHDKLRRIEVFLDQRTPNWDPIHQNPSATHESRRVLIGRNTASLCDDVRGLTLKDFGLLNALDIFVEIRSFGCRPELHETLREELELNMGAAVNSSVLVKVLISDRTRCYDH